jgi:transmembrane sensor
MNPSANSEDIEAAAAAWLARRESGSFSSADHAALEAWLEVSTAHRVAYIRLVTAWERSGRLQALGAGIPAGVIPPRHAWGTSSGDSPNALSTSTPKIGWPRRRWATLAAGVAAGGVALALGLSSLPRPKEYTSPVGRLATVPLLDGSTITLNTDSQIHVHFTATERRVTLDRGEAFFQVARDPGRPFVVRSANTRATAIGTQFMVRRDQGHLRLLVTEGRVQFLRETLFSHSLPIVVGAGAEANTQDDSVVVDHPTPNQMDASLSWRSGYLVFHDSPLAEAIAEFNRYTSRPIVIDDPTLATLKIGGRFRFTDSEAFLWLLQSGFPIRVTKDATSVHLSRR